jgi:hypothetical protein
VLKQPQLSVVLASWCNNTTKKGAKTKSGALQSRNGLLSDKKKPTPVLALLGPKVTWYSKPKEPWCASSGAQRTLRNDTNKGTVSVILDQLPPCRRLSPRKLSSRPNGSLRTVAQWARFVSLTAVDYIRLNARFPKPKLELGCPGPGT